MNWLKYVTLPLFLLLFSCVASADWTPPVSTPLGDKVHPRIYFIPDGTKGTYNNFGIERHEVRDKAEGNIVYRGYLEDFVTYLDGVYTQAIEQSIICRLHLLPIFIGKIR